MANRAARITPATCQVPTCKLNTGFTLIEALVALIVIALVATVALETQVTTLKLEQAVRDTQALRFAVSQTLSASHIYPPETFLAGRQFTNDLMSIRVAALTFPEGSGKSRWLKWELCPNSRPTLQTEVFTRPDEP